MKLRNRAICVSPGFHFKPEAVINIQQVFAIYYFSSLQYGHVTQGALGAYTSFPFFPVVTVKLILVSNYRYFTKTNLEAAQIGS